MVRQQRIYNNGVNQCGMIGHKQDWTGAGYGFKPGRGHAVAQAQQQAQTQPHKAETLAAKKHATNIHSGPTDENQRHKAAASQKPGRWHLAQPCEQQPGKKYAAEARKVGNPQSFAFLCGGWLYLNKAHKRYEVQAAANAGKRQQQKKPGELQRLRQQRGKTRKHEAKAKPRASRNHNALPACGLVTPGQNRAYAYANHHRHGKQARNGKRKTQLDDAEIIDAQQGKGRQAVEKSFPCQREKQVRVAPAALQRMEYGMYRPQQGKGSVCPGRNNAFANAKGGRQPDNSYKYSHRPHCQSAKAMLTLRDECGNC